MEICAKTKLKFLPDNCRACPLSERLSPNVEAKCRILQTYMHDGSDERPTSCPLKAKAEGVFIDCTVMDKLPGSCEECKMGDRYGCVGDVKCRILDDYFTGNVKPPYKERPDECPLTEIAETAAATVFEYDLLPLEKLKELSSAAGPAIYTQPVFIRLKLAEDLPDGTWDGTLGFAAVKFDETNQFVKAWMVGNPDPFKLEECEYGKTWGAYLHKPDFIP